MKVTLISHTPDALELLIFTKATRLNMTPSLLTEIAALTPEQKLHEAQYIANTIESSWEFVDYTFLVEGVSRAYTHQQVRTRAASYAQQSMRVTDMCDYEYVMTDGNLSDEDAVNYIRHCNRFIKDTYKNLIAIGQAPEDARGILPTNIATNIVCKFNLRTLSGMAKSRTGGRTQKEYQKVINAMIDAVLAVHPWAEAFMFNNARDYFAELEAFAERKFPDLKERGELLKIVDHMRKG
jgi:flavin-dependent thymidylate synthase